MSDKVKQRKIVVGVTSKRQSVRHNKAPLNLREFRIAGRITKRCLKGMFEKFLNEYVLTKIRKAVTKG